MDKRLGGKDLAGYWVAQFVGGIAATATLALIVNLSDLGGVLATGLGRNGYDAASAVGLGLAFVHIMGIR